MSLSIEIFIKCPLFPQNGGQFGGHFGEDSSKYLLNTYWC